ncbi:unnamed protein product [Adineta steineri]|uniref:Uncharacterized protein n=1 Tax=Adineta steineri TaxID=433720 RepID=A0A814IQZ1_9BILA|nr:unnamed protein product [Adineta steineri]CAF1063735.1 unnamed protein product [Adineta steineri]
MQKYEYERKNTNEKSQIPKEQTSNSDVVPSTQNTSTSSSSSIVTTTKNKKHKKKHLSDDQRMLTDMPDERLAAYGLNPKNFRNFVVFNKDKKTK